MLAAVAAKLLHPPRRRGDSIHTKKRWTSDDVRPLFVPSSIRSAWKRTRRSSPP